MKIDKSSKNFFRALRKNAAYVVGFVANFVLSTTLWACHNHIFQHIVMLSSAWRKLHQLTLSMALFTPFTCLLVGQSLFLEDHDKASADGKATVAILFVWDVRASTRGFADIFTPAFPTECNVCRLI